jgi:hypothetical protein
MPEFQQQHKAQQKTHVTTDFGMALQSLTNLAKRATPPGTLHNVAPLWQDRGIWIEPGRAHFNHACRLR